MERDTQPWRMLWNSILRLFYPTLNNVYYDGSAGEGRINEVFASEPNSFLQKILNYLYTSMYPQTHPWIGVGVRTQSGIPVDKGKLSVPVIRHLDEAVSVVRYLLKEGSFYEEKQINLAHALLLGNSAMRAVPVGGGMLQYIDMPVHRVSVQRDNLGRPFAHTWSERMERWQVTRDYGADAWMLFKRPADNPTADPEFLRKYTELFGQGAGGGGIQPSGMSTTHMNTIGTVPNAGQDGGFETVIKVLIPNIPTSGIPGGGNLFPEMTHVCYVVTEKTKRLLDV